MKFRALQIIRTERGLNIDKATARCGVASPLNNQFMIITFEIWPLWGSLSRSLSDCDADRQDRTEIGCAFN